jgi:hypothetical protein
MNDNKRTRTTLVNGSHTATITQTSGDGMKADLVVTMAKPDGGAMSFFPLYSLAEQALVVQLLRTTGWTVTMDEVIEEEIVWVDEVSVTMDCTTDEEVQL